MTYTLLDSNNIGVAHVETEPKSGVNFVAGKRPLGMQWTGSRMVPPVPDMSAAIKEERNRRLGADFEFQGKMFQRDQKSLQRITGAATLAGFAMAAGAQSGDLRWANPDQDFGWIASDDTVVPMDAQTAFAFGQAAAGIETSIIFAAKVLRTLDPTPDPKTWNGWP